MKISVDSDNFVWFDSLCPIKNLSVIKGQVFLGWTSTKLGFMFLLKDITQWRQWGLNPRPFGQLLYHWATALPLILIKPADLVINFQFRNVL